MEYSLALRVAAVFIIAAASLCGVGVAYIHQETDDAGTFFSLLKACAAGILFGIGLIHLLPDADSDLSELYPDYSLAFAVASSGVIVVLLIEQLSNLAAVTLRKRTNPRHCTKPHCDNDDHDHSHAPHTESCGFVHCSHSEGDGSRRGESDDFDEESIGGESAHDKRIASKLVGTSSAPTGSTSKSKGALGAGVNGAPSRGRSSSAGAATVGGSIELGSSAAPDDVALGTFKNLMEVSDLNDIISLYILELSVAIHSIIIGVNLGQLGPGDIPTLISYFIALCFHQFVEGVGVGAIIRTTKAKLQPWKVIVFVGIFCFSVSFGILIGIMTYSDDPSNDAITAKGIANSFAAGCLFYVSLVEMLGSFCHSSEYTDKPFLRVGMTLVFGVGVLFTAILAIWA